MTNFHRFNYFQLAAKVLWWIMCQDAVILFLA